MQRLRLASGLVLFVFALLHFLNHALGIVSVELMDAAQTVRRGFWRSQPGTVLLVGAGLIHLALGLYKIAGRRTLRMPFWEAAQIAFAVYIPYGLVAHILATRGINSAFGVDDTYVHELSILWPSQVLNQTLLLLAVWIHAVIGLHFWLKLKPWYRRAMPMMLVLAVLIPALASWGWIDAARRLAIAGLDIGTLTYEEYTWLVERIDRARIGAYALVALAFAAPVANHITGLWRRTVTISYPGGQSVKAVPGATLLEISRANGIPHASVCGGRARCSTCRSLILDGLSSLPDPDDAESRVLNRIAAEPRVRLACQIRPTAPLAVQPLVPANEGAAAAVVRRDAYHWGVEKPAVVMFADLRDFTTLSEERLAYDVVFLLNRYLGLMSDAIRGAGGSVDKFIGDGIMALFGISEDLPVASRQALRAAIGMDKALTQLNDEFKQGLETPLRMGIGIHAGPLILGRIGAAGGDQAAASITALGDTVNAAARLETETKHFGTPLVVSDQLLTASGVAVTAAETAAIQVKGKRQTLTVHAISDFESLATALDTGADDRRARVTAP